MPGSVTKRLVVEPLDGVQWVHVLALMGDASDNVPGVPGVGAKGALSLIQQYGSVESVLENAEKVENGLPSASSFGQGQRRLLDQLTVCC